MAVAKKTTVKSTDLSKRKLTKNNNSKNVWIFVGASIVILVLVGVLAGNFTTLKDIFAGMRYQPSDEMVKIRDGLELTGKGIRIFNAVQPELLEKEEFNQECREQTNESAILGCYRDDKVYVYNIIDGELSGIRELTTAHELLHAVYHRMTDGEKKHWSEILKDVYNANSAILGPEIEVYNDSEKAEELYVRAGTEIWDLPDELERHFEEIFENQNKVVDYYNSYIKVFLEIEKKMDELLLKINDLTKEIETKSTEYKNRAEKLNTSINEFNECAKTLDCFSSNAEFNAQRGDLTGEQNALSAMYDDINHMINEHNSLVSEYNENVLHGQTLNKTINSL